MRKLTGVLSSFALLGLLGGCGSAAAPRHHKQRPFASFCISRPTSVAPGVGGSFYIQDQTGILHIAASRRLLGRIRPAGSSPIVTNQRGAVYYAHGSVISEVSPQGRRLRIWYGGGDFPIAVSPSGDLLVSDGGVQRAAPTSRIDSISPSGKAVRSWRTPNADSMAFAMDGSLFAVGGASLGTGSLYRLDPVAGRVLTAFGRRSDPGLTTVDLVTSSPNGHVYVAVETGANAPFAIQAMNRLGNRYSFKTLNQAQELVAGLAVDNNGAMLVVRGSYARAGNVGVDELSERGRVLGTFPDCGRKAKR